MRLKNKLFFGKDLAEWKIVSTFALAFEKSSITRSNIKKEQENEEKLVLQNIPLNSLTALTGNEKEQVRKMYGNIFGGDCLKTHSSQNVS